MNRRDAIKQKILARVVMSDDLFRGQPCHIWTGPTSGENGRGAGYPRMSVNGQTMAVHKVAWTNENGIIPGKKQLDHACRRRLCVNEAHLDLVTHKENCKRRDAAKGQEQ